MSIGTNFHSVWCDHSSSGETHDDRLPYCMKQIHGVATIPLDGEPHPPKLWVYATAAAHPTALTSGERVDEDEQFEGVELTIEKRVGDEWVDQTIRLRSDAARSLAATLTRAADIQQGLTR